MTHRPMVMARFRRGAALLLVAMMMVFLNSCSARRLVQRPVDATLDPAGETVRLHWSETSFDLSNAVVKGETLTGNLFPPGAGSQRPGSSRKAGATASSLEPERAPDRVLTGSLNVYVDRSFPLLAEGTLATGQDIEIPFANISTVQVVENNTGKAVAKTFGAIVLTAGIAFVIILATKDSCPFIYVENGGKETLVGEIYSGAIHPPLERDDYMALPVDGDGDCRLRITNEVLEIQHTNLAELLVFDHAPGERVLVDRHGTAHRLAATRAPAAARDLAGNDVSDLVTDDDGQPFREGAAATVDGPAGMDGLVVSFDRPAGATQMKLVVNARNSRWLDHVTGLLFERMGDQFKPWQEAQKSGSAEAMQRWCRDQGLPLAVSLQTPEGWRRVDHFDLPGPIAERDAVLAVDLAGVTGDQVTVKLECGYRFWEIDSIAADFTAPGAPAAVTVGPASAVTGDGQDVAAALVRADNLYLDQPSPRDEARVLYHLPPLAAGKARSVTLHSRGHYEILRDPVGQPDAAFVASFRQPGRMDELSREMYRELSAAQGR